jgi:hypothetical protein
VADEIGVPVVEREPDQTVAPAFPAAPQQFGH